MQETRNRQTGFRWFVISSIFSLIYSVFRRVAAARDEEGALKAARWLTHFVHDPLKSKRLDNYRKFYGGADHERDEKLDAAYLEYMTRMTSECIYLGTADFETIRARGELQGGEHIDEALKRGKGVILLNAHMGNYYASHAVLEFAGYKSTSISEKLPIASMERQINRLRKRFAFISSFVDENAARTAIKTFRANGIFSIFFEVTIRKDKAIQLPLGSAIINLDLGPAILAARYQVPVLPMSVRSDEPYRCRVRVHPPLPAPAGKNDEEKARNYLEMWRDWLMIELKENPSQWWPWFIEDFLVEPTKGTS